MIFRPFFFLVVCLSAVSVAAAADPYDCRWAESPIVIDGKGDDEAWKRAVVVEDFALPWLLKENRPALTKTRARLLWDRDGVYFFAEMEDSDLYAMETKADGFIWEDDVFELFFKPSPDHPGYYEFEVNARNAVLDMFLPRRNAGGYRRHVKEGEFKVESKVELRGTLNNWRDSDEGWSVEGRIPWAGFAPTGGRPEPGDVWTYALCRYDYSVDLEEGMELSTSGNLKQRNFHTWEGYEPIRFAGPDRPTAVRETGGVPTLRMAGTPEPPPPYVAERVLPDFKPGNLVYFNWEPGHPERLLFIDREDGKDESRLRRLNLKTGGIETLLAVSELIYGFEFHPRYSENGQIFLGHNGPTTVPRSERSCRISRYRIDPGTGVFDADSGLSIIDWPSGGHDGSAMAFDENGLLYVTTGDGSNDSDTDVRGQGLDHLLSKVLRIDVDRPADGLPYSVPKDNPFLDRPGVRPETWAYGLRNPWRMSYDRESRQLWVGNNGQDNTEQAYLIRRGANYGWSVFEGSQPFRQTRKLGPDPVSPPTLEHWHAESRSLTGGLVYRGPKFPDLVGAYVYGDNSTGKIWAAKHDGQAVTWRAEIADTPLAITAFNTSPDGDLWVADYRPKDEGGLYRLVPRPPTERPAAPFPTKLSQTGLFRSVKGHVVEPALLPYAVNAENWVDGAEAARFVALPADRPEIGFTPRGSWKFPDGTVILQSFRADGKWVESRVLLLQNNEWAGYSYAWNEEQSDADLVPAAGLDRGDWHYPSRSECMNCHSRASGFLLGLQTAQMNRDFDYGGGGVANQIAVIESLGLFRENRGGKSARLQREAPSQTAFLSKPIDQMDRLANPHDETASLDARARAYLHANCSHCHVPAGGGNSTMNWQYHVKWEEAGSFDEPPNHGDRGLGGEARIVKPGNPGLSVMVPRVASRGEGQMPPIGTKVADSRAVTLLIQWIAEMQAPTK